MSGVGKTELATFLKEENPKLLHISSYPKLISKIFEMMASAQCQ